MNAPSPPESGSSSNPRISELFEILPRVHGLRPFLDLLVERSAADPGRRWSGSGALGTVGDRRVEPTAVSEAAADLGVEEAERLAGLLGNAAAVVRGVARSDWSEVAEILIAQGRADERTGRHRDAEAWYGAARRVAKDRRLSVAPRALRLAARTARSLGDLDTAAARYEEAHAEAEGLALADDEIVAAIGRGNVEVDRGRWDSARTWYERGLDRMGRSGAPRRERWQVLQNLAIVHRREGNLPAARETLRLAEAEAAPFADPDAKVEIENGWGQTLLAEGDPRGAELHFREALSSARTATARVAVGVNLGESLLLQGKSLEAGECARQAEAEALAGAVAHRLPETYRLLARVTRERREGEAFVLLEQALEIIRERGLPRYEEAVTREALGVLRLEEGEEDLGVQELRSAADIYQSMGMETAFERLDALVRETIGDGPPGSKESDLTGTEADGANDTEV